MARSVYSVKEVYLTLQGEGGQAGRAAVFCRFTGCNLWTGREQDRATAACRFCDTDFIGTDGPGGGRFEGAMALARHLSSIWAAGLVQDDEGPDERGDPYVVFTGGEPMLQLDEALITACHAMGFEVGVETNGTQRVPASVDWICVSPKPRSSLVQKTGHELKLVYPQREPQMHPRHFAELAFGQFYLQPLDDADRERHTAEAARYCMGHPKWRLSLQSHKLIGIP